MSDTITIRELSIQGVGTGFVPSVPNGPQVLNLPYTEYPKLCLNMIVKNESRVIERFLNSVSKLIDACVICDTGSTDNTQELCTKFFETSGIPGTIVSEPFRDFGYNRSFALEACRKYAPQAEYVLLMDADMVLTGPALLDPVAFKKSLVLECYRLFQGSLGFFVENTRIVKNALPFRYWGVTHEYIVTPPDTRTENILQDKLFINDVGDGGSKADKFERDIRLLEQGLKDEPGNDRYTFYLANSLKDFGRFDDAIMRYKERILLGGWKEEVWQAHYKMAQCYESLGKHGDAIYWYMEAHQFYPDRIENLYKIAAYYRHRGKNHASYAMCVLAKRMLALYNSGPQYNQNYLFFEKDIYDYKLDFELSIVGYYVNYEAFDLGKISMNILSTEKDDHGIDRQVLSNYKFYSPKVATRNELHDGLKQFLNGLGRNDEFGFGQEFVRSTPSITETATGDKYTYTICIRYVNYRIDNNGNYVNREHITTHNVLYTVYLPDDGTTSLYPILSSAVLEYNRQHDGHYVGLEDVRLMGNQFCANRGVNGKMCVEYGTVRDMLTRSVLLEKDGQRHTEKNWVLIPSTSTPENSGKQYMVYEWYPLTIGNIENNRFVETSSTYMPPVFKHIRGSTNGVLLADRGEIWFIVHTVSYEDRRYYYHMFVVLDANTHALKRYSRLFTFEGERVEYTLGFVWRTQDAEFLIGYSVLDRDTRWVALGKSYVESLMCK